MPIYEYLCDSCGFRFEQSQKMNENPLEKCPKCGEPVRRVIGLGLGLIFKGSRFYRTDYQKHSTATCCGRPERCEKPPCSDNGICDREL